MRAWLSILLLPWMGCTGSEACVDFSDEVLVVALWTDEDDGARIEVELRRAGEDSIPVKLCSDHTLEFDGDELVGVRRPSGAIVYEADVASVMEGAGPVQHRLTLSHRDEVSEFAAEVDAPGFAISAPEANAKVSRAADMAIAWAPVRDTAMITLRVADEIDGETCLAAPVEQQEADDGETTIAAGGLALAAGKGATTTCEAFVTLSRRATVSLETTRGSAALHPDSRIEATNSRVRPFLSVP